MGKWLLDETKLAVKEIYQVRASVIRKWLPFVQPPVLGDFFCVYTLNTPSFLSNVKRENNVIWATSPFSVFLVVKNVSAWRHLQKEPIFAKRI